MMLPADSYVVVNKTIITDVDKNILIDLYQPIVGNKAISLYFTLLNDLSKKEVVSDFFTHHHLLSSMQMSMEDIKFSRERLEGIGLLSTFLKKGDVNNYVYCLYGPVSASDFFNHPILNIVLYNNVGKNEYEKLVNSYKIPKLNLKDYDNVTKKFDEVFSSVPVNGYFSNESLIARNKGEIAFKNAIDFEVLISGLDESFINKRAFSKDVRHLINSLSFLYDIDMVTMQNLIKACINEKGYIDKELLRKSARNFYQFENSGNLPTIIHYSQPSHLKSPSGDLSNKGKMIYTFENTNPYQFLKSKQKSGKVSSRDLKIIEDLLVDFKLSPACVNVLVDYVLRISNQKLNKAFIETIASHWKRLGIETAVEAMDACIREHKSKKNKEFVNKSKKASTPDWFDQNIEKKELNKEEEEELVNLIKNYE